MNSKKSLLSEKLITFHPPHLKRLTLSWRRPLSYRNQSIDLLCKPMGWLSYRNQSIDFLCKSMDWFLYITVPVMKELSKLYQKLLHWLYMRQNIQERTKWNFTSFTWLIRKYFVPNILLKLLLLVCEKVSSVKVSSVFSLQLTQKQSFTDALQNRCS